MPSIVPMAPAPNKTFNANVLYYFTQRNNDSNEHSEFCRLILFSPWYNTTNHNFTKQKCQLLQVGIFVIPFIFYTSDFFSFFFGSSLSLFVKIIFWFSTSNCAISSSPAFMFIFNISSANGSSKYF